MKTKKHIVIMTLVFVLIGYNSCKYNPAYKTYNVEDIKHMLRNFYTSYIIENSTFPVNQNKRDSIERKYCTTNAYKQFGKEIEYDIFLKSQMVDSAILSTLTIKEDSLKRNLYYISYKYGENNVTVKLQVVKEREDYKIDLVFKDL